MWSELILTLLVLAAPESASTGPSGAGHATLPEPVLTRQAVFAIPFRVQSSADRSQEPVEVQLYFSGDLGASWRLHAKATPAQGQFVFRAPADGEFWFVVRTVDRAGQVRPQNISGPELRVVVETTPPNLLLKVQRGPDGQIIANWEISKARLKPDSFSLQYRMGSDQPWETVAVGPQNLRASGAGQVGEVTWWPRAKTGILQVRAEVADAAGNPAVSHAQIDLGGASGTQVAAGPAGSRTNVVRDRAAGPDGSVARSGPEGSTPWRPSGEQPTAEPPSIATKSPLPQRPGMPKPSVGPRTDALPGVAANPGGPAGSPERTQTAEPGPRELTAQRPGYYGAPGPGMAQNPLGNPANPGNPVNSASAVDPVNPNRPGGPGPGPVAMAPNPAVQNQYPADPNATSRNPADRYPPSQYPPQRYADTPQRYPADQYPPQTAGPQNAGPQNPGPQNPAPHYMAQVSTTSSGGPDRRQLAPPDAGPLGGSSSRPRMMNTRSFQLEYDVSSVGPSGISRVELWATRDGGQTWNRQAIDEDNRSPILVNVDEEGVYGLRVVVRSGAGLGGEPPKRGDAPDLWIGVDLSPPSARITNVEQGTGDQYDRITIQWEMTDRAPAARPITLSYSPSATGPWTRFAGELENTGRYVWQVERGLPERLYIRLEAVDEAGNVATVDRPEPILFDRQLPLARIRDVRPMTPPGPSTRR